MGTPTPKSVLLISILLFFTSSVKCDETVAAAAGSATASGTSGSPAQPVVTPPVGAAPPGLGGLGALFPGLGGLGFNKHLDFNAGAGFGPFLGGLGGLGGGLGGLGGGIPPPVEGNY
jgi:hypothetical protein